MYNDNKFGSQLRKFREDLFGPGCFDVRDVAEKASRDYRLPNDIELIPCVKNSEGEWVPKRSV